MKNHAVKAANAALDEQVDQAIRSLKRCKRIGATYRGTVRATFSADFQVDQLGRIRFAGEVSAPVPELVGAQADAGGGIERSSDVETVANVVIESTGEITYSPFRDPGER